jgi:hypothetical protein
MALTTVSNENKTRVAFLVDKQVSEALDHLKEGRDLDT